MKPIVHMLFGSWVYGTNVETSDKDYKQVFIPPAREIILGQIKDAFNQTTKLNERTKNTADDIETEYFSLKKYMNLLLEGQTVSLDMLFTPDSFYIMEPDPIWTAIQENKHLWLHSGILSFIGYARQQANKYGIRGSRVAASRAAVKLCDALRAGGYPEYTKLRDVWPYIEEFISLGLEHTAIVEESMKNAPDKKFRMLEVCNRKVQEGTTLKEAYKVFKHIFDEYGTRALQAENNEGVDWKATGHAIRITEQAKEILLTSKITFPRPNADYLKAVRLGQVSYKEVAAKIEQGMEELDIVQKQSILQKVPDFAAKDKFIYDNYLNSILKTMHKEITQ